MEKKRKPMVGDVVRYVPLAIGIPQDGSDHIGLVIAHNTPARVLAGWPDIVDPGGEDEEYIVQFFDYPGHPEPVLSFSLEVVEDYEV